MAVRFEPSVLLFASFVMLPSSSAPATLRAVGEAPALPLRRVARNRHLWRIRHGLCVKTALTQTASLQC